MLTLASSRRLPLPELVFFYGTLMSGFDRHKRNHLDDDLKFVERGWIGAALFDLGLYPAAIPANDARVWGEVHELVDASAMLPVLDEIEGCSPDRPETSLYVRAKATVTCESGAVVAAWVYFYNAPLGKAQRIESGDYRRHLHVR